MVGFYVVTIAILVFQYLCLLELLLNKKLTTKKELYIGLIPFVPYFIVSTVFIRDLILNYKNLK